MLLALHVDVDQANWFGDGVRILRRGWYSPSGLAANGALGVWDGALETRDSARAKFTDQLAEQQSLIMDASSRYRHASQRSLIERCQGPGLSRSSHVLPCPPTLRHHGYTPSDSEQTGGNNSMTSKGVMVYAS